MQITNIEIENFKSLQSVKLEIRPVTILIGPNNSGKSSVLQALGLLKQSIGNNVLVTNGPLMKIGDYEDIVFGGDSELKIRIGVSGRIIFQKPFSLLGKRLQEIVLYQSYTFIRNSMAQVSGEISGWSAPSLLPDVFHGQWNFPYSGKQEQVALDDGLLGATSLSMVDFISLILLKHPPEGDVQIQETLNKINLQLSRSLTSVILVPVVRGQDRLGFQLVSKGLVDFVDAEGHTQQVQRAISAIAYDGSLEDKVSGWYYMITGSNLDIRMLDQSMATLESVTEVDESGDSVRINILNEGFGPNQLAYLLIPLAAAKRNSTVGIEEPEVHLHPTSQISLTDILAQEALDESKQLIITTHSEYLVSTLLTMVAEGKLKRDSLAVYSFEKDDVSTKVTPLKFDDKGQIEGGLPSFFRANLSLLERFTKALESKK